MAFFTTLALGAGSARSGMTSPGSSWFDIAVEEETRVLRMGVEEWKEEQKRMIREWRGRDMRQCLAEIKRIEGERIAYATRPAVPAVARPQKTQVQLDFDLWREMVEEPAKFGDDITDWLELDAKLRQSPGRWRLEAYWMERQLEEEAKEEALVAPWRTLYSQVAKEAAVTGERRWLQRDIKRIVGRIRRSVVMIQAAVRGHLVRNGVPFRDCCMCLSHRICPLRTDVGMMCRACATQGPYVDITGPVSDGWNWFRAEYEDLSA